MNYSVNECLRILHHAEQRLNREITIDEVQGGALATILIPEDYAAATKVILSTEWLTRLMLIDNSSPRLKNALIPTLVSITTRFPGLSGQITNVGVLRHVSSRPPRRPQEGFLLRTRFPALFVTQRLAIAGSPFRVVGARHSDLP